MRELYIEGLATRGGPEPCIGVREGVGEALEGVRAGRAIEPRNHGLSEVPTPSPKAEGNTWTVAIARRSRASRGRRTRACMDAPCARTGISHARPRQMAAEGRAGKSMDVIRR